MLVEFRVENFRSFREEQVLSLVAGRDTKHPGNCVSLEGARFVKAALLYGANASGKSNVVSAFRCMKRLVQISATQMNQGDPIPGMEPFRLDRDCVQRPCNFVVAIVLDGVRYDYSFAATSERVHAETLSVTPPGERRRRWLTRQFNPATGNDRWRFSAPVQAHETLVKERTRPNGLALSRAAELNVPQFVPLYKWFNESLHVTDMSNPPPDFLSRAAESMRTDDITRKRLERLVRHADLGIAEIEIAERKLDTSELPPGVTELLSTKGLAGLRDSMDQYHRYRLYAHHRMADGKGTERFAFEEAESKGTQRFLDLTARLLNAMAYASVVVIDEFDCSMHPLLSRKLLELFQSEDVNRSGAQLVGATHDSSLMDETLFRRDQLWFVEKPRSGASVLYSLYDFADSANRPRSDAAFERNYLAGRYGAVPLFGPALEDQDL